MYIPEDVKEVLKVLHDQGHEAYIVGGCVRDMILGDEPHDYDITSSAEPVEVKGLFKHTIDTGIEHGTVTVMLNKVGYEVTTYRVDGDYTDHRRPDQVHFTKSLKEDLKRRDFTINAMAYNEEEGIVDLFNGREDLDNGVIKCVGNPLERFEEDALRMLRAIRFAARFHFEIEEKTSEAIRSLSGLISKVSAERIHVELTKTLCSDYPEDIEKLVTYGLIEHVIPEFMPNINMAQNHPYHVYTVDQHTYACLKHTAPTEALRWAIYLHDIGKGYSKTTDEDGIDHFYGHVQKSVELSRDILNRLKFDNKTKKRVLDLIDYHDYRFKPSLKATRRAMAKMGKDLFLDYIEVQKADISGQAPDKCEARIEELAVKTELYHELIEKQACVTIKDMAISGNDLMALGMERGQAVGLLLHYLLDQVIENPSLNKEETLLQMANGWLKDQNYESNS